MKWCRMNVTVYSSELAVVIQCCRGVAIVPARAKDMVPLFLMSHQATGVQDLRCEQIFRRDELNLRRILDLSAVKTSVSID